jgi:protein TonB
MTTTLACELLSSHSGRRTFDWFWGFVALSMALHLAVVLLAVSWHPAFPLPEKPEDPGIEVDFVIDAAPAATAPASAVMADEKPMITPPAKPEEKIVSKTSPSPAAQPVIATRNANAGSSTARGVAVPAPHGNPRPEYPDMAKRKGWQGECLLRVAVSPEGKASAVSVHRSSGYASLDQAALAAVRRWRFLPQSAGGTCVASTIEVPVNFSLL